MPRRNKNARQNKQHRELIAGAVLVKFDKRNAETMSPGKLRAVAEWREPTKKATAKS